MSDLVSSLSSALDKREELAKAASSDRGSSTPGGEHWQWECGDCDATLDITPITVLDELLSCPNCEGISVALRSVEEYPTSSVGLLPHFVISYASEQRPVDALFIAANDPSWVLRDCEAKRRVLERHAPKRRGQYVRCASCCEPVTAFPDVEWPCDEIRDLAYALGVEVPE